MNEPRRIDSLPLLPADVLDRIAGTLVEDPHRLGESPEEAEERRQRAHDFRLNMWQARVPLRFRDAAPSDLDARDRDVVRRFPTTDEARTLVFRSEKAGVGKTHAAFACGNHAVISHGFSGAAWAMVDFNDAIRPGADGTAYDLAHTVDLLILDDLGRERLTEWTVERLQGVMDARWRERRKTVITTNLPGAAFVERYGDPLVDRIRDGMWFHEMTGTSRRRPAPW